MPPIGVQKLEGSENATLKKTKQHTYKTKPQGLPNFIKNKNDEKPEKNWSKPNDVGVICNERKQTRQEKPNWTTKGVKMS